MDTEHCGHSFGNKIFNQENRFGSIDCVLRCTLRILYCCSWLIALTFFFIQYEVNEALKLV